MQQFMVDNMSVDLLVTSDTTIDQVYNMAQITATQEMLVVLSVGVKDLRLKMHLTMVMFKQALLSVFLVMQITI